MFAKLGSSVLSCGYDGEDGTLVLGESYVKAGCLTIISGLHELGSDNGLVMVKDSGLNIQNKLAEVPLEWTFPCADSREKIMEDFNRSNLLNEATVLHGNWKGNNAKNNEGTLSHDLNFFPNLHDQRRINADYSLLGSKTNLGRQKVSASGSSSSGPEG
ncbi:hypothetical protein ACOSQ3_021431 [Xanthoceras sorbifolium]